MQTNRPIHSFYRDHALRITNEQSEFYRWWLQQFPTSDPFVVDQTRADLMWNGQDAICLANVFALQMRAMIQHANDTMTNVERYDITDRGFWMHPTLWHQVIDSVYSAKSGPNSGCLWDEWPYL